MIAICPNPYRDLDLELSLKAKQLLEEAGFETCICPVFADGDDDVIPDGVEIRSLAQVREQCSLLVVIGGDGTILSVARGLHELPVPLLGVNMGTKGFLANLEPADLPLIVKAARGEYQISRRMTLNVDLQRNGEVILQDHALNDVVLHGYGDCIVINAWCEGDRITRFSGDGVILSTPTGSTGYSMSAGGPIVEPSAQAIILSPICAHMLGARTFVFSAERTVTVRAEKLNSRKAYLSVDGNSVADLCSGDTIVVRRSPHPVLMADLGLRSFYEIAYEKLT